MSAQKAVEHPKSAEVDVQILEIELARAKLNLKEAETALERGLSLEKNRAISAEEVAKFRFAVEARRLDIDLAVRRLQIAVDRQKKQADTSLQSK